MIDPRTGQRHELISPPPTRTVEDYSQSIVQDYAQPISKDEACREARAERDRALKDFNRTIDSIRSAEEKLKRLCG